MPLREKIAAKLSAEHTVALSYKNILVTHGCMGAISTLLLTLLEKGDEVLLPEPTYPAYKNIVAVARAQSVFVPCLQKSWVLDIDKLEQYRTEKTKVIIFSNPCNPCGVTIPQDKIEAVVAWCKQHKIYLIVDEAYDDYIFTDHYTSITPFVLQSKFVIRTGSYSKSLSMSGWRVGYMVVDDELSMRMGSTQDALLNCPNVFAQYAVLYALDHPNFRHEFHKIVKKSRDLAVELLQPLVERGTISFQEPDAGFFLFLKTAEEDTFPLCKRILNEAKVGLIPGSAFGPSGSSFMRLCFARKPEVVQEGIERLNKFFGV